ncbi:E3 ubiquitin-protein ligase MARCH2-like [Myzus persicae]|uniref:E3 ubiquitin-protein ligase MARCH2-like n=1 Tax=Myzus persicae TaxID=13164 RepID=UPI000B932DA0|nr:E3 ubiquitin-protein ligase MARCH2-like [Myzus persicae]
MSEANENIPETLNLESRTSYPRQLCSKTNKKFLIEALENEIIPNMPITTFKEIQTPESKLLSEHRSDSEESNRCISPCLCRGSISKVHRTCLEKWLLQADSSDCEICTFKYNTRWITKYSLLGSIKGWFFSKKNQEEIKELFRDLFILLIIVLLLSWLSFLKVFIIKLDRDIQVIKVQII